MLEKQIASIFSSNMAKKIFTDGGDAAWSLQAAYESLQDVSMIASVEEIKKEIEGDVIQFNNVFEYALLACNTLKALHESGVETFYGSDFDIELGNMIFFLCCANGIDLEDSDAQGYCNKATSTEICDYNSNRISEFIKNHLLF